MNKQKYITSAFEIVTTLTTGFGGFLVAIAPPEEADAKFAVGISSFLSLVIFLFIAAIAKRKASLRHWKYWLGISGLFLLTFAISIYIYRNNFAHLTFLFPPDDIEQVRLINGTEYTPKAVQILKENPDLTFAELLDKLGGENQRHKIWTQESIENATNVLLYNYIIMILSLTISVFCITEGVSLKYSNIEKKKTIV